MDNINLTNLIFDKTTIIFYLQKIIDTFNDFDGIVGDVPVAEQLSAALEHMALKDHTHDEYAARSEVVELKKQIEKLLDLVGDVPVSEQINASIKNILLK